MDNVEDLKPLRYYIWPDNPLFENTDPYDETHYKCRHCGAEDSAGMNSDGEQYCQECKKVEETL